MKCINCGIELSDNAKFCFSCGAKQGGKVGEHTEPVLRLNLDEDIQEYDPNDPDIQAMNQRLHQQQQNTAAGRAQNSNVHAQTNWQQGQKAMPNTNPQMNYRAGNQNQQMVHPSEHKKQPKQSKKFSKWIWFAGGGVVVVAAAATAAVVLLGGSGAKAGTPENQYVQFVKDNQLNTLDVDRRKYTPKTYDGYQDGQHIGIEIQYTGDGKYMCYPSDWEGDTCRVYIVKTGAAPDKAEKVDSDISQYWLLSDARVVYLKDHVLYMRDKKGNKEKLASNVAYAVVSEDTKSILWLIENTDAAQDDEDTVYSAYDIYHKDLTTNDEKQKLISNARLAAATKNQNKILVIQDGTMYMIENSADQQKIDTGVAYCLGFSEDENQFFYCKDSDTPLMAMDIVNDDMAVADAQLKEPIEEDYKTSSVEKVGDRYEKVETTDWDAYNEAKDAYWDKQRRDELRENLNNTEIDTYLMELYTYDAGKIQMVDDHMHTWMAIDNQEIVYSKMNLENFEKLNLSEISHADEAASYYNDHRYSYEDALLYNHDSKITLDGSISGNDCRFNEDGSKVYALTNDSILLSYDTAGSGNAEEIMDDVDRIFSVTNEGVYYLANRDTDGEGDLYYNDQLIDSDVYEDMFYIPEGTDTIYYGTDRTLSDVGCTLKMSDAGKTPKTVAENVSQAFVVSKNKIFLLTDYSVWSQRGDLKLYSGKETLKTISEGVSYMINPDLGL